jgi:hypothetical protein
MKHARETEMNEPSPTALDGDRQPGFHYGFPCMRDALV